MRFSRICGQVGLEVHVSCTTEMEVIYCNCTLSLFTRKCAAVRSTDVVCYGLLTDDRRPAYRGCVLLLIYGVETEVRRRHKIERLMLMKRKEWYIQSHETSFK